MEKLEMKYKKFVDFLVNETKVLTPDEFLSIKFENDNECEKDIFDVYPNHYIIIETQSGKLYEYKNNSNRKRYNDIDEYNNTKSVNLENYKITDTEIGEQIKDNYQVLSGDDIVNVYVYET